MIPTRRAGLCGPPAGRAHRRGAVQSATGRGCVDAAALAGRSLSGYQCCAPGQSRGQLCAAGFSCGPSPGNPRVASHGLNAGSCRAHEAALATEASLDITSGRTKNRTFFSVAGLFFFLRVFSPKPHARRGSITPFCLAGGCALSAQPAAGLCRRIFCTRPMG